MLGALEAEPSPERRQPLLPLRSSSEQGWDSRDFGLESPCKKTPPVSPWGWFPEVPMGHCLPQMPFHQVTQRCQGLSSRSEPCVCGSALLITAACVFPVIKRMTNRVVLAA